MTVLHFDSYLVLAKQQIFVRNHKAANVRILPFNVPTLSIVRIRRTAGNIIPANLVSIDVKHHAIIHLIVEGQNVLIGKRTVEIQGDGIVAQMKAHIVVAEFTVHKP